ncbi:MAG: hypothetical protein ABSA81_06635 [Candidatus Bathyarchaeia archaeon]|jgi:hypothetical protein
MGRTIPSWWIIIRAEDQIAFEDLLNECKLYVSAAEVLASSVKEFPLLLAMLFVHHRRIIELERRMKEELK